MREFWENWTLDLSVHLYYADMVNLNAAFRKTLSISINSSSPFLIQKGNYNVPKPNMPSYVSALKVTKKDSSTQTGGSQIISPTSVNTSANSGSGVDSRRSLSKPASAGSSGVSAPKPTASTNTNSVAANISTPVKRRTRSLQKGNQKDVFVKHKCPQ